MGNPITGRLRRGGWPLLATGLALVPFLGAFSATKTFFIRDLGMYFWPRHLWHQGAFRSGNWPFWDPYAGGGQSAVADALNQFFLLPVTLIRVLLPPVAGFNFWVAAPSPLMALGTWLWLRRHVSPMAAFVGAAVAVLSGPVVSTGNFPNYSWAVAFFPWMLWAADRVCVASRPMHVATLATFVGLQALAGEPVTFAVSCAVLVGYIAFAVPAEHWRDRSRTLLRVGAALGAGALLAAVQLIPLLYAVSRSLRAVDIDETFWSLHPLALLDLWSPQLFGHAYYAELDSFPWMRALNSGREPLLFSLYTGVAAFALALVGTPGPAARRWRIFWWTVFCVALLSALGRHTLFYPTLQRILPVLDTFRFPLKYLVVSVFALAALAASGADALVAHSRGRGTMNRPRGLIGFLTIVGAVAALLGGAGASGAGWLQSLWNRVAQLAEVQDTAAAADWMMQAAVPLWLRLAGLTAVIGFMTFLVWQRHRFARAGALIVCGVAVVDLLAVNHDLHPTIEASRLGPPEWIEATRAHADDRVYVGGRLRKHATGDERLDAPAKYPVPLEWDLKEAVATVAVQFAQTPAAWGVRELISYDLPQLLPRDYMMTLRAFRDAPGEARLRYLRRTGTRYCFQAEPPFSGARRLAAPAITSPVALYECHDNPQRLYVTASATVERDLARHTELMLSAQHDPLATVLLAEEPPAAAGEPAPGDAVPAARIVRERNMELVVSADVGPAGGYLNVLDSYDPFWIVDVDGRRAPLLRANGLFRAVRLAPGRHEVRFSYRPFPVYVGAGVSAATGALLLVWCCGDRMRRRRFLRNETTLGDSAQVAAGVERHEEPLA